ncbi:MAG TPA: histidinol dehydrogenase [Thermoanaerobaculia bacterium]|jgi:histidinol dehydrogenase
MPVFRATSPEAIETLRELEERRRGANEIAFQVADEMIAGVRARGDTYVAEQVARFDGVQLAPDAIRIAPREVTIDSELAKALDLAIQRVENFHLPQLPPSYQQDGLVHRVRPIRRVGIYAPGGRAVYVSTLIMCAVPARIAGVRELVVATTPAAASRDELHYVCNKLGIREIYQAGGAAGIAALALGTESLPRVDKIVGPGNAYVTAAKARLIGEVGIDMTAGPTELVVICDETASPEYVVADLLAQAEHGSDSAVICLSTSASMAEQIASLVPPLEPNRGPAIILTVDSLEEALAISDRIAPEHLSLQTRNATELAQRAENAGAIYCGPFSPPASGDYVVGTNHVLPTSGSARFFSPLGVYDFVKRTNVVTLTRQTLAEIGPAAATIARFEGLPNHATSCDARNEVPA